MRIKRVVIRLFRYAKRAIWMRFFVSQIFDLELNRLIDRKENSLMKPLVVIGAGGFGREVLDILESINEHSRLPEIRVIGVIDDSPSTATISRLEDRGYVHLGGLAEWLAAGVEATYIVAIGNPLVRSKICSEIDANSTLEPFTAVHPSAVVGSAVRLGKGSVICAGVQVSTNVNIGDHVHLNPGAIIGHDTDLEDFVSINPGAVVSGEVHVRSTCLVGAGAVVLQGLTIGAGSTVGAGGVVTRDVGTDVVVKGVPAR